MITAHEQGYWQSKTNQRLFFESLAKKLSISKPSDWGRITLVKVREHGGGTVLNIYNGSLHRALKILFKDIDWKNEWFINKKIEKSYWKNTKNQRAFFDDLAKRLNITSPQEWSKVSNRKIKEEGGAGFISKYYSGSVLRALQTVYPEYQWKREWFSHIPTHSFGYWKDPKNQRRILENFAKKYEIKEWKDWGKITINQIIKEGGSTLIWHHSSLRRALEFVFPEVKWEPAWFINKSMYPQGYWKDKKNQRKFFEELGKKLKIQKPKDWGKISRKIVAANGGDSLLSHYYGNSIFKALKEVFPDIPWKREWFVNFPLYPTSYWSSLENQRRFLSEIATEFSIKSQVDWRRITAALIRKKGGKGLLARYKNSLALTLSTLFPSNDWTSMFIKRADSTVSNEQEIAQKIIAKILPGVTIYVNFRHPGLSSPKSTLNLELDIYIPKYSLAFEYHGSHHFRDTYNKRFIDQQERDALRRKQCKSIGITLIEIPYWWDNQEGIQ